MGKRPETCAVVVTYNRKETVEKCIKGILSQQGACCDILILDNGSTDGTRELFSSAFTDEKITYRNMGENLGCTTAQARGIRMVCQRGYRYIWLMDDDVIPYEDTLKELLKADRELHGKWGVLSSVAYWTDGSICEANRQKKTLFRFMREADYGKRFVRATMVSAASMFIKTRFVRQVGLPISEYYIYTDDYEFSSRIGRHYPVYVVPSSKVTHAMKVNGKANIVFDTPDRMYRYKYLYRNDVHCYRQFGLPGYLYLIMKFAYIFVMIVFNEKSDKKYKLSVLINGYRDGFRFEPTIEKPEW